MDIIYISRSFIPSRSANSIHVMKMCQAFANEGHDVELIVPRRSHDKDITVSDACDFYGVKDNFKIKEIPFLSLPGKNIMYAFFTGLYLLVEKKKRYFFVYARFLEGAWTSAFLDIPTMLEVHSLSPLRNFPEKFFFKMLVKSRNLKRLIVITRSLKKEYDSFLRNTDLNVDVFPDGSDSVSDFNTKRVLCGKKDSFKVGYVGHLYPGKGMEIIVDMVATLPANSNIEFHIVGGTDNDIDFWKQVASNDKVFFYGHVSPKYVGEYINAMDVCVLPNKDSVKMRTRRFSGKRDDIGAFTSPLKMFDYMSHGKMIIASDLPVLREVLNEENSLLIKPDDINEWICAIESAKNPVLRKKFEDKALSDFNKYTWGNRARGILKGFLCENVQE
jgi:glycosyltransferase involved in cell wall biosynthesis